MNIDGMRLFCMVYEEGSIARAAARCFLSHQAVSKRISGIEKELEVSLFDRSQAGLAPTEAGIAAYNTFSHMLEEYQDFCNNLEGYRTNRPSVRIVIEQYCASTIDVDFLLAFEQTSTSHAAVEVEFCESNECFRRLLEDQADIAIINEPVVKRERYEYHLLDKTRALAMVAQNSPLARKNELEPADFQGQVLLTVTGAEDAKRRIDKIISEADFKVEQRSAGYDADAILNLVRVGRGVHLVPEHLRGRFHDDEGVVKVPFPAADALFGIGLTLKKVDDRAPYLNEFLTYVLSQKSRVIGLKGATPPCANPDDSGSHKSTLS